MDLIEAWHRIREAVQRAAREHSDDYGSDLSPWTFDAEELDGALEYIDRVVEHEAKAETEPLPEVPAPMPTVTGWRACGDDDWRKDGVDGDTGSIDFPLDFRPPADTDIEIEWGNSGAACARFRFPGPLRPHDTVRYTQPDIGELLTSSI
jgi:hypothetical protein